MACRLRVQLAVMATDAYRVAGAIVVIAVAVTAVPAGTATAAGVAWVRCALDDVDVEELHDLYPSAEADNVIVFFDQRGLYRFSLATPVTGNPRAAR